MHQKPRTVEEFLAQGGKITKLPPGEKPTPKGVVKSTVVKPTVLYTSSSSGLDAANLTEEQMKKLQEAIAEMSEEERQQILGVASADLGYRSADYATAANEMGERSVRKKKEKIIDVTTIDLQNIPDSLRKYLGL